MFTIPRLVAHFQKRDPSVNRFIMQKLADRLFPNAPRACSARVFTEDCLPAFEIGLRSHRYLLGVRKGRKCAAGRCSAHLDGFSRTWHSVHRCNV